MEILVYHGANPAILVEAHPHVGTDKLPGVIVNIRKTIQKQGGEIRFGCRVSDLIIRENSIQGVIAGGQEIASRHVILATGHSARDIYRMLQRRGVRMEPKDFACRIAFRAFPAGDRSHPISYPGRERQMVTCC